MSLTDAEILELEKLFEERDVDRRIHSLENFNELTSPNYKLLHDSVNGQEWGYDEDNKPKLINGVVGVVLEGSSRSTKTFGGVFFIMYLCLIRHKEDGCTINIYRETYNEFKTTLYDDFKRVLNMFKLPNKFMDNDEVKNFKIGKSKIHFLGDGKHGGGCDYAFFNEAMMIKQSVFDQVEMRCRKFWWMDYNPSFTQHWVFDSVTTRPDVAFLRTTYKDNPFISPTELNKIRGYEPWQTGSYEVTEQGELLYRGEPISETNQPPPHIENIENGTADEFMHKCYGLGLRGAMKGVIFPQITWIDEFPDLAYHYGLDFGFVSDPCAFGKYAREGRNIYLEPLIYQAIPTAQELDATLTALGVSKYVPITADSSDKYVSEKKGTTLMVRELFDLGWEISKVSKTKNVMYWLLDMKNYKIHIVKNHLHKEVKREVENYIFKEVNGIQINQPIDKFNHFWDQARYAHMSHSSNEIFVDHN